MGQLRQPRSLRRAGQLAAGHFHVCATSADGRELTCWGDRENGNIDDVPAIQSCEMHSSTHEQDDERTQQYDDD